MWDNATTMMVVEGIFVTLYMTLATTFMGYVLGLPMGIALVITAPVSYTHLTLPTKLEV